MGSILLNLFVWFLLNGSGAVVPGQAQAHVSSRASAQTMASTRSPHGNLNLPCQNCHTFTAWKPIRSVPEFDHDKTSFPLRGMHEGVACRQCHTDLVFSKASTKCADCHADIHRRQFGANCENCHTVKGWNVSIRNIQQHFNRFPLVGAHGLLECDSCHKNAAVGQFQGLSTDCMSCHATQFQQTSDPNHAASQFSTTCQECHSMDSWLGVKFDHLRYTGFALTGMHASLDCNACHVGNHFKGTPVDCVGCHAKDFATANNPDHVKAGFPTTCSTCHNTSSWTNVNFNHAITGFPLTGGHANLACSQCHLNGNFTLAATTCSNCHMADFQKTNNPSHAAAGFPTTCQTCHNTTSWLNVTFNHAITGWPLTGGHANVPCAQCHVNGNFKSTSTVCSSCHMADFQKTTNPNHPASGFPTTCNTCHNTTSWQNVTFDHSTTGFPLTGAHATVPCSQCHVNNNFNLKTTACSSCHMTDYQKTNNPNHAAAGFPTDCSVCHSTASWANAKFDHSATGFPLTGAHATLQCQSCHVGGQFTNLNPACVSCHLKDFQGTNNPNHTAAGFPQQCQVCHNTTAWIPASFNHNTTGFPLTGAHVNVPCASCHINGQFAGTPTDCYSCHKADYQNTTDPNHVAAAFPTTCALCHNTTSWSGATFNHTWFPIYSGTHAGVWSTCGDCHTNSSNYAAFSCINCHTHSQA
ncbi:MAG TPA: hypothetical protein VKT29_15260, partial [Terriglobales bacterium]|nr:hypothetical protein [Terriglobales bacterium]